MSSPGPPNPSSAPTRILFMGTPEFAVPSLAALHAHGPEHGWSLAAVATQPDRPAGRGKQLLASPVKQFALGHGLPVLQFARLRRQPDAVAALQATAPDLLVVAAYGLILPKAVLAIPRWGAVNVHASLLPAYRGASPITAALLDGRRATGVSIMLMDEGMDTGPVLAQAGQPIGDDDTAATLSARLAEQGAALLVATLPAWLRGEAAPVAQEELPGEPSVCYTLAKEAGQIDWRWPAVFIERMTRAYAPWPSAFTIWHGEVFKVWRARILAGSGEPGRVLATPQGPAVGTGEGILLLEQVQPAGKRVLDARSFVNGAPDFVGSLLG